METGKPREESILIVMPPAQEAATVTGVLEEAGFAPVLCPDLAGCSRRILEGAGAVVMAEEALESRQAPELVAVLEEQPPWSDLPVLVLTKQQEAISESPGVLERLNGSVTLLGWPLRAATLLSSLRMALRARRRQYQVRDLLAAQRESAERFRNYAESTGEVMWMVNLRQQQLEYLSPAFERVWGRSRRGVGRKEWLETVHPEDRAMVAAAASELSAGSHPNLEYRIIRPDGSVRWITDHAFPIYDVQGGIQRIAGIASDVTSRKQAEMALQTQNRRLALLNEAAGHLLSAGESQVLPGLYQRIARYFGADAYVQFRVSEGNERLELEYCWGFDEQIRRSIDRLEFGQGVCGTVAQNRCPMFVEHIQQSDNPKTQLLKQAGIRAHACSPLLARGRLLGTLAFASRQRDSFEPEDLEFFETLASYVALAKDRVGLTEELRHYTGNLERKVEQRTARLQETVNELEQMSYSIIHDMRAPLRAMTSFAQMLMIEYGGLLRGRGQDFLRRITEAAHRMDLLITDALNYNRLVRSELPLAPVDAARLLRSVIETYPQFQAPQADIRLEGNFPLVLGNEGGLTQCFSNLLGNAVKFVRPGQKPQIRIWAEIVHSPQSTVHDIQYSASSIRLWFEDNGIGIPKENQDRIFNMFQQMHIGHEGTGIGLALVRKAAERMGGKVGVQSEEGKGSRFWLELKSAG